MSEHIYPKCMYEVNEIVCTNELEFRLLLMSLHNLKLTWRDKSSYLKTALLDNPINASFIPVTARYPISIHPKEGTFSTIYFMTSLEEYLKDTKPKPVLFENIQLPKLLVKEFIHRLNDKGLIHERTTTRK